MVDYRKDGSGRCHKVQKVSGGFTNAENAEALCVGLEWYWQPEPFTGHHTMELLGRAHRSKKQRLNCPPLVVPFFKIVQIGGDPGQDTVNID